MSGSHSPAVAALIEACMEGLAKSEFLYRNDWPDVGRVAREMLRERVMAVLSATGIPLEVLASMTAVRPAVASQAAPVVGEPATVVQSPAGTGKSWWWWK